MKLFFYFSFLIIVVISCKKNDPIDTNNGSFPGALDSVAFFRTSDSTSEQDQATIMRNYYDNQKRVTKIIYATLGNNAFHFFYYNGNDVLPYKMTDSALSTSYAIVANHLFNYDNSSRLVFDSINSYDRDYISSTTSSQQYYSITNKYGPNYMASYNSKNISYCAYKDTSFFNASGDIQKYYSNCIHYRNQSVESYSTDKNPLSTLNVHPLYNYLSGFWFWIAIQNLDFNIAQPKLMYKKLSGINTVYYRNGPNDLNVLLFSTEKDASNRITKLIISNYTYSYNFSGNIYLDSKFYTGYKFFYHQ
jgi:hypothetical protein